MIFILESFKQSFGLNIQIFVFEILNGPNFVFLALIKCQVLGLDLGLEAQVLGLGLEAQVLGLGLEARVFGLGLEAQVLGLGLGLELKSFLTPLPTLTLI